MSRASGGTRPSRLGVYVTAHSAGTWARDPWVCHDHWVRSRCCSGHWARSAVHHDAGCGYTNSAKSPNVTAVFPPACLDAVPAPCRSPLSSPVSSFPDIRSRSSCACTTRKTADHDHISPIVLFSNCTRDADRESRLTFLCLHSSHLND